MKVLIPLDGSEPSQNTLHWIVRALNPVVTPCYLFTVIPKGAPEEVIDEYQVEDALAVLENAQEMLVGHGFTVERTDYAIGDPAEAICHYAEAHQVDQVVMGSHGRHGLGKLLLGSVSSKVFECSPKPVLIQRNTR